MPQSSNLARKEKVAIVLITMTLLTLLALALMFVVFEIPSSLSVVFYEISLAGASIILPFFGFSTWYYNSNAKTARRQARIFIVIILLWYAVSLLATSMLVDWWYAYNTVNGYFKTEDIFDVGDRIMILIAVNLGRIVAVVMIVLAIWFIIKKIKRK